MPAEQASSSRGLGADARIQTVISWAVTALGVAAFHLFHIYAAIGELVMLADDHGHSHSGGGHLDAYATIAEHNSGMAWMMGAFLVIMIIAPVIGLTITSKLGAIATLAVGAIYSLLMILDGFSHGLTEGNWTTLVVALVGIALPATVAVLKNLQWLKAVATRTDIDPTT